jgi:hypothetical protein
LPIPVSTAFPAAKATREGILSGENNPTIACCFSQIKKRNYSQTLPEKGKNNTG